MRAHCMRRCSRLAVATFSREVCKVRAMCSSSSFDTAVVLEPSTESPVHHGHQQKAVVRPSITWGVVGDKSAQKEGREKVLELLRSKGIITDEFQAVELPTSTDVMIERLDFLKNMGLEVKHINEYPLVVCCSVKKNMVPVINYLEALGFSTSQMTILLQKYPMVLHSSVTIDIQPVVVYLLGIGVGRYRIPDVLLQYPDILGFRIEGTMSTSIAYLVSLGVNIREIHHIVERFPQVLGMRVGNNIQVKVHYLRGLGIGREAVGQIIERNPRILGLELDVIKERVEVLTKLGVHLDSLPGMILHYPRLLLMDDLEKRLRAAEEWLKKEFKVSSKDFARIIERLPQVVNINPKEAFPNVKFLKGAGFKSGEIAKVIAGCPLVLVLDVREWMQPSLDFLKKDMKRELKEVVEFPTYFTYGLEERIRFRYRRVAEKGIKCSLAWFLNCSNAKFQERLEIGCVDDSKIPEVEFCMGGPIISQAQAGRVVSSSEDEDEGESEEDDGVLDGL